MAPVFNIHESVMEAAYEFFSRSRAWRHGFGPLAFDKDVTVYTVSVPADTTVVEPTRVELDAKRLISGSFWSSGVDGLEVREGLHGHELTGEVAVAPLRHASELPDRLGLEFGDAIVYGAIARLLRVPQVEWSDYQRAGDYYAMFLQAVEAGATRAENGFKTNRTRVVRYGGL